jgi:hypothetical protein
VKYVVIVDLGGIWILYSKVIFRISMHKIYSAKTKMFGWDFGKYKMHSRKNAFYKFSFLKQKSESKKNWILILACDSEFC